MRRPTVAVRREEAKIFTDPAPCDTCSERNRCGFLFLACPDFETYVSCGLIVSRDRRPTPEGYDRVYDETNEPDD